MTSSSGSSGSGGGGSRRARRRFSGRDRYVALAGFACAGAGFSIVFPTVLSAAGRTKDTVPALAVVLLSAAIVVRAWAVGGANEKKQPKVRPGL